MKILLNSLNNQNYGLGLFYINPKYREFIKIDKSVILFYNKILIV